MYGYIHPNSWLPTNAFLKIFNTFDEAKKFIFNLPKYRIRHTDVLKHQYAPLHAKIICEGKDFWIEGNSNDVYFKSSTLGSNNPIR